MRYTAIDMLRPLQHTLEFTTADSSPRRADLLEELDESYELASRSYEQRPDPIFLTFRRTWAKLASALNPGHHLTQLK